MAIGEPGMSRMNRGNTGAKEEIRKADLSKVKEIYGTLDSHIASKLLKSGKWILLDAKVVESHVWSENGRLPEGGYVYKSSWSHILLGRVK